MKKWDEGEGKNTVVIAIHIPGLNTANSTKAYYAIIALHDKLKALCETNDRCFRILSSLQGAFLVFYNGAQSIPIIPQLCTDLTKLKIPWRLGLTYGMVKPLRDIDEQVNFIGRTLNTAARLATAPENPDILFHSTFFDFQKGVVKIDDDWQNFLGDDRKANPNVKVPGKVHDKSFPCYTPEKSIEIVANFKELTAPGNSKPPQQLDSLALAFDLPRFSEGDDFQLTERFREFVTAVGNLKKQLKARNMSYAPGGDGGIFVFAEPRTNDGTLGLVSNIRDCLERVSGHRDEKTKIMCRIGLHTGSVPLYENGEGIDRPTGTICFIADEIAKGQAEGVIVFSEELKQLFSDGSENYANAHFLKISPAESGAAKGIARFCKKGQRTDPGPFDLATDIPELDEQFVSECYGNAISRIAVLFRKSPDFLKEITSSMHCSPENDSDKAALAIVMAILTNFRKSLDVAEQLLGDRIISSNDSLTLFRSILSLSVRWDFVQATAASIKSGDRKVVDVPFETHKYTAANLIAAVFGSEAALKLEKGGNPDEVDAVFDLGDVISGPGIENKKSELLASLLKRLEFNDAFLEAVESHTTYKAESALGGLKMASDQDLKDHLKALWDKGKPIACILEPDYAPLASKMNDYSILFFQKKAEGTANINQLLLAEQATISVAINSFTDLLESVA